MRARVALATSGAYSGASSDDKALREWRTRLGSADADSLGDLPTLRKRTRDLVRNNPTAAGAVATMLRNVVGTGLIPRPMPDAEALGLTDDQAAEWARQAERIFWAWATTCDIERRQPFWEMQQLVLQSELESGDLLTVRRFAPRPGDVLGLKLQIVEADRICNPRWRMDTATLRSGVETDLDGAVVNYWVLNHHPHDPWSWRGTDEWVAVPAFSDRDGSRLALHTYRRKRPGQTRGIPFLAPVIVALKQIGRYTEAELMAAVISGMLTAFIKTEAAEGLGPLAGDSDAEKDAAEASGEIGFGYAAIVDLAPGESVEIANPGRPNAQFDPFVTAILRQIGVALEIPFELLVLHFTSSYSAARAALLEAWKAFRTQRDHLAYTWCQPIYEWVITEAVARRLLPAPGFHRDPLIRAAWLNCEWRGPAQGQIDPKKEVDAAKERIALNISTIAAETQELTGGDFEANIKQRKREIALIRDAGLDVEPSAERVITESSSRQITDDPDEEEKES